MDDYVFIGIISFCVIALFYAVMRVWFGNGLLTRFAGVVLPSIGIVGNIGVMLGREGATASMLVLAFLSAVFCATFMFVVLYKSVISKVQTQAEVVLKVAGNLSALSEQASASAEEQAASIAQVSSSIDEIDQMSWSTNDASRAVVKVAGDAVERGNDGLAAVREAVRIIEEFVKAADFVEAVGNVSAQSNLLAVNAGIEASKAGEAGRGFSVVASEVRSLAKQSKDAAEQIRSVISKTQEGHIVLEKTYGVITSLARVLQETADTASQISGAVIQQSSGIKQISAAMEELNQNSRDSASASREIKNAANELSDVSAQLAKLIHGRRLKRVGVALAATRIIP